MVTVKVKLRGTVRALQFPAAPVAASAIRERLEGEDSGYRVSRLVLKGRNLQPGDAVPAGAVLLAVGEMVQAAPDAPRSGLVEVYDIMGRVFTHLPLSTIRLTCMRVCHEWRDMAETETRNHPQRYTVAAGELFDLFSMRPQPLLAAEGVSPSDVVEWVIHDARLFLLVAPPPAAAAAAAAPAVGGGAAVAGGIAAGAGDDDGDAMAVDAAGGADGGGGDGLDDDGDDIADEDLWPELVGMDDAIEEARDGDGGSGSDSDDDGAGAGAGWGPGGGGGWDRPPASAIQRAAERVKRHQQGYRVACFDLVHRRMEWSRSESLDQSRFPCAGLSAGPAGAALYFWDRIVLLDGGSGRFARDFVRDDPTSPLLRPPFLVPRRTAGGWRSARAGWELMLVAQGKRVSVVDTQLRHHVEHTFSVPHPATELRGHLRSAGILMYDTPGRHPPYDTTGKLVAARCPGSEAQPPRGKPARRLWHVPAHGDLAHVSDTNVLWRSADGPSLLFDVEGAHYHFPVRREHGRPLALMEGRPPELFAEGLFLLQHMATGLGHLPPQERAALRPEEAWEEMVMTDTRDTIHTATNSSKYPFCPNHAELEQLEQQAPPAVQFRDDLDLQHPLNVAARGYSAYRRLMRERQRKQEETWWSAMPHAKVAACAITRQERAFMDRRGADGVQTRVERGLKDLWMVYVPFSPEARCAAERIGNYLYLCFTEPETGLVGVYSIAIDRGFIVWRRLWQDTYCLSAEIRVLESIVLVDQRRQPRVQSSGAAGTVPRRAQHFLSRADGSLRHSVDSELLPRPDPKPPPGW